MLQCLRGLSRGSTKIDLRRANNNGGSAGDLMVLAAAPQRIPLISAVTIVSIWPREKNTERMSQPEFKSGLLGRWLRIPDFEVQCGTVVCSVLVLILYASHICPWYGTRYCGIFQCCEITKKLVNTLMINHVIIVREQCSPNLVTNWVWWTLLTNFGKLFMNIVYHKVQKGGLVNSVQKLWQIVHEHCSPKSAKRGFVEQSSSPLKTDPEGLRKSTRPYWPSQNLLFGQKA